MLAVIEENKGDVHIKYQQKMGPSVIIDIITLSAP